MNIVHTLLHRGKIALFALAALLVLAPAFAQSSLQEIKDRGYVRIAVANEIPYGYVNASGQAQGIAPDVAKKVLAEMGIDDIEWIVTEFGSLIPGLKAGRYDLVAASQAVLPDRCQQVDFSHPNSSYGEGFLVKAGNPEDIHSYQDFLDNPDLKMGIVSGADQLDFAHDLGIPDSQLVAIQSNTDALSAVATGRIDAYAATGLTVGRLAANSDRVEAAQPFEDPIIDGEPVRSWGAFTFNSGSDEFREAFNQELDAFHQTDEYREILNGYGMTDQDIDLALSKTTEELCAAE